MLNTIQTQVVFDRKHVATKVFAIKPVKGLMQFSITLNGERRFLSTGIRVYKDQVQMGRIVNHEQAQELNDRLDNQVREIIQIVNDCDRKGRKATFAMLRGIYFRAAGNSSWTDWMAAAIAERKLADGTRKHHVKVLNYLISQGFTDKAQMTVDTVQRIDRDLHNRKVAGKPMMQTSIYDYHKVLKGYIHIAIRQGFLDFDPYTMFQTNKGKSREREVLTMEDIQKLMELKTLNLYMQHVRDLFLMQIWTGISVGDMMTLDFKTAVQGDIIKGVRGKTGEVYTTVLLPQARNILEHYHYRLPVMAYDDYRRMIQPTLQAAGIEKPGISTHNARHTFATTVTLAHGVPIETVSKMLGHTSVKTTQIYAKVLDSSVQEQAARLGAALGM